MKPSPRYAELWKKYSSVQKQITQVKDDLENYKHRQLYFQHLGIWAVLQFASKG